MGIAAANSLSSILYLLSSIFYLRIRLLLRDAILVLTDFVLGDFLAALDDVLAFLSDVGETLAAGRFLGGADDVTCDVLDLLRQAVGGDALIARFLGDGADGGIGH